MSHYLATILTKLSQRYSVLYQHIGFIVCCSYVSFVCILCFYPVALCIVVFCCFPLVAVGDILSASAYFWAVFSVWGFVPPLVFEALSSFCWGFVLMFILRLCPHILYWGLVLIVLYWGFVLIFYTEALSSYFILRFCPHVYFELCPHILYWGFVLIVLYWGFVLIFYFEALSSSFILRLCPHVLYWGFVLIVLYWGYVPQFEALVLIVLGPCCFVCTAYLICLQWYVCGSVCLYFCLG